MVSKEDIEKIESFGFSPVFIWDVPTGVAFDAETMKSFPKKQLNWAWETPELTLSYMSNGWILTANTEEALIKLMNMFPTPTGNLDFVLGKAREFYERIQTRAKKEEIVEKVEKVIGESNYFQVIPNSQFYNNLEQIKQSLIYMRDGIGDISFDYMIKGIENSIEKGYNLQKVNIHVDTDVHQMD